MLSSLLDTLKTQFTSKSYWLGSMVPLLLFLLANGILVVRHVPSVATSFAKLEGLSVTAIQCSLLLLALLSLAFILSVLTSLMTQVLEGQYIPVLRGFIYRTQWARLTRLDQRYDRINKDKMELDGKLPAWIGDLGAARKRGKGKLKMGWWKWHLGFWDEKGRWCLPAVRFLMRHGFWSPLSVLSPAIIAVSRWLEHYDAGMSAGARLDAAQNDLVDALQFNANFVQYERIRLLNERQFHFPGVRPSTPDQDDGPSTHSILAPTRLGNIGKTMRSYSLSRYNFDLDIFWTRLQSGLQKDGIAYYNSLQDMKAQVDCMVTIVWLSALFTLLWSVLLLQSCISSTELEFRLVAGGGAATTILAYWLACESYSTFADVMRSAVDLFRLKIIDQFSLPAPYGSDEERDLWERLGNAVAFGAREQFRYKS